MVIYAIYNKEYVKLLSVNHLHITVKFIINIYIFSNKMTTEYL